MIQFILMVLISLLTGVIAAGMVWLAMDFFPKFSASLRAWKAKRALAQAAAALESEESGEEAPADDAAE